MKVYDWDLLKTSPEIKDPLIICLGGFESLHLGHYELVKEAKALQEKKADYKLSILMLKNPISKGEIQEKKLFQLKTRLYTLDALNFDYAFFITMQEEIKNLSVQAFIEKLKEINVKAIVCGPDFRFGHNRLGNVTLLKEYFEVSVVKEKKINNKQKISSSLITELIEDGLVEEANKLLIEKYAFITNINRFKFTYPTNLIKLKAGIYCVNAVIKDIEYHGLCLIKKTETEKANDINKLYLFDLQLVPSKHEEIFIEFEKELRHISTLAENDLFEKDLAQARKFFENN